MRAQTLAPRRPRRDDVAFWLYSSGSTGTPKGAVHLHSQPAAAPPSSTRGGVLGIRENDVVLLRGEAVLRLRPRQRADVPALGRRHRGAARRAPDARRR